MGEGSAEKGFLAVMWVTPGAKDSGWLVAHPICITKCSGKKKEETKATHANPQPASGH